jgi:hypothetical protein
MDRSHAYMRDKDIGYGRVRPTVNYYKLCGQILIPLQVLARDDTIQLYQDALKAYSL